MLNFSVDQIIYIAIQLVCIVFSVMVHEIAHGYAAFRLGDPTAKRAGRLTLNPAKHLDPVGSVAIPLVLMLMGGPIFAYAKPVPYNPYYFKNRKKGELIVAFSGPFSNLAQALLGVAIAFAASYAFAFHGFGTVAGEILYWTYVFGSQYCLINLVLFFFNIFPLPPLDGASIVAVFLNNKGLETFYRIKEYSMFILMALLVLVPMVTPWSPVSWYFAHTAYPLFDFLMSW